MTVKQDYALTSQLDESKRGKFIPSRGRKQDSEVMMSPSAMLFPSEKVSSMPTAFSWEGASHNLQEKRGPSFFLTRGKKLVSYPFSDYKSAPFMPLRGRKAYEVVKGVPSNAFLKSVLGSPAYLSRFDDSGWKRGFKFGVRGKKSSPSEMTSLIFEGLGQSIQESEPSSNVMNEGQLLTSPSNQLLSSSAIKILGDTDSSNDLRTSR